MDIEKKPDRMSDAMWQEYLKYKKDPEKYKYLYPVTYKLLSAFLKYLQETSDEES